MENAPQTRADRKGATRLRILDAAIEVVAENGLASATIAAIARKASVTRQTVYTQFGDRTTLLRAAFLRVGEQMVERSRDIIETTSDPAQMVISTVFFGLREFEDHPVLKEMTHDPASAAILVQAATNPASIELTKHGMKRMVELAGWTDDEADFAIELILRTTYSLFTSPGRFRTEAELEDLIARWLLPAVGLTRHARPAATFATG